jgi:hypothetical protein
MATDSSQSGYLSPGPLPPDYDANLEDIFQRMCCGITELDGQFVRPRWQVVPGNTPDQEQNWCAYGMTLMAGAWDAFVRHDPNTLGGGSSTVERSEVLHVNFSFYGPNSQLYATLLRDGMSITQNRDVLAAQKIKFIEFMDPVTLPVLLKDTWNRRVDLKGVFHRWVTRTYSVGHFASASGTIDNERYVTPFSVSNP